MSVRWLAVAAIALMACGDDADPAAPTSGAGAGGSSQGGMGGEPSGAGGTGGAQPLPALFTIDGVVMDEEGNAVADAMVMQGGVPDSMILSGADGSFSVEVRPFGGEFPPALIAAKAEYRGRGLEIFELPTAPITLPIYSAKLPDNPAYSYQDPGDGVNLLLEDCTHCHTSFTQQFLTSKHAVAASDPLVQDLYSGVSGAYLDVTACNAAGGVWKQGRVPGGSNTAFKCYLGGGVLPDLNSNCGAANQPACDDPAIASNARPTAFGACADCHAPAIDGVAGGRDLQEATGLAFEKGVSCDPCHKVKDVDLTQPPGIGQRLIVQRPAEPGENSFVWVPLTFGPLVDVGNIVMGASPQPKFKESVYCAGCHEQQQQALIAGDQLDAQRWPNGLSVHSTYQEWLDSPYNQPNTQCQFCHMPASATLNNSVDNSTADNQSIIFGFTRAPEDTREHIFRSPLHGNPRFIDSALFVSVNLTLNGSVLTADVDLSNIGAGHAIPTGEPMRSLTLVIEAQGGSCGSLTPTGGFTINDIGGALASGVEGNDVSSAGTTLTWAAAAVAQPGQRVRVVRASGAYDDYDGVGLFAGSTLPGAQKGMPIQQPVGQATVVSSGSGQIVVDSAIAVQPGDIIHLGEAWPTTPSDGQPSLHLAGAPGYSFARVLVDSNGSRHVPHYRAVDIVSDNRIKPAAAAHTTHVFDVPMSCTDATVRAKLLYRPVPLNMATLRGWSASDYIVAAAEQTVTVP